MILRLLLLFYLIESGLNLLFSEVEKKPTYLTASVGESVVFTCDLDFPQDVVVKYIVNWHKEVIPEEKIRVWTVSEDDLVTGTAPGYEGRVSISKSSFGKVSVNLTALRETDDGWYECKVIFPNRTPTSRPNGTWTHLTIKGSDLLGIPPTNQTVMDGESAKFDCVTKAQDARVTWYKDGTPLSELPALSARAWVGPEGSLTITHTDITDLGQYKCEVTGKAGESQTATAYLNVLYKARVIFTHKEVFFPFGKPAILDCGISANPPLTKIQWDKDGYLFDPHNVQGVLLRRNGSLYFNKVEKTYEGIYVCTPYNDLGTAGRSDPIKVIVQHPPVFTILPQNLYLRKVGDSVHMHCAAQDRNHRPTIKWIKTDETPLPEGRYMVTDGNLTITDIQENDRGLYQCIATNEAGTITADSELLVEDAIQRGPNNVTGKATHDSVSLTWKPGFGSSTQHYSVLLRALDSQDWRKIKVSGSQTTVTSLDPGREYEFIILSYDYSGEGMFSKPLRVRTQALPEGMNITTIKEVTSGRFQEIGQPKNLRISIGPKGYTLEWDEPEFGTDILKYYIVNLANEYTSEENVPQVAETTDKEYFLGQLKSDSTYHMQVKAVTINNKFSSSVLLILHIPPKTKHALAIFLAGCLGFIIATIIICIYSNRMFVRKKLESMKTSQNSNA